MKIGIDASLITSKRSGIGWYIVNILENLSLIDKNNEYYIYLNKPLLEKINVGSNFKIIEDKINKRIIWQLFKLPRILKNSQLDLFFSPNSDAPILFKGKIISTIHDLMIFKYSQSISFKAKIYYKFFTNLAVKKSTRLIADSKSTKKDIISIYKNIKEKIDVIYLSGDSFYKHKSFNKTEVEIIKKKFKIKNNFGLFVGMDKRKNLYNCLKAINSLNNYKLQLVVCGIGKIDLKDFNNLKNRIIVLEYISKEDLINLYNIASFFLYPSFYEGFGMPILEAMACGTPVITSNTSSMPEVAGDAAILVDPNNVDEIKTAIEKVLNNESLRKEMIKKGYEQVKKFSWEKSAKKLLEVFEEVGRE